MVSRVKTYALLLPTQNIKHHIKWHQNRIQEWKEKSKTECEAISSKGQSVGESVSVKKTNKQKKTVGGQSTKAHPNEMKGSDTDKMKDRETE